MKIYENFNKQLEEMLEFLELERSNTKDVISRVYEVQYNTLMSWANGKPRLQSYLSNYELPKLNKDKVLKKVFNARISQNKAQLDTVKNCISEKFPIYLIQGPPGTGKTSVIVEIIKQELNKYPKKKILISSQSNLAVDNVLEKLIEFKKIKILRIGQDEKISKRIKPYLLENIKSKLVFNHKIKNMLYSLIKFILLSPVLLLSKNPKSYYKKKNSDLYKIISEQINVVGATCIGSANQLLEYLDNEISLVIVDEAGRSTPMETLVPLQYADRAILVGDHKQLPPVIKNEIKSAWIKTGKLIEDCPGYYSYFEYLLRVLPKQAFSVLNVQFRMHPQIGNFVSQVFYNKEKLSSGTSAENANLSGFPDAISYHSTSDYGEEQFERFHDDIESYYNAAEAKIILKLTEIVTKDLPELSVSIISFYSAQVELLKQLLNKKQIKNVEVATLDSYQGREQDIIILSLVRCNQNIKNFDAAWYKFFLDIKRLNVAMSRAKKRLMIVGNLEQLLEIKKNREHVEGLEVAEKLLKYIEDNKLQVRI